MSETAPKNVVGLKVFYKGSELIEMSIRAIAYHDEKAKAYRALATEFKKLKDGDTQKLSPEAMLYNMKSGSSHRMDPVAEAEGDAARHERLKRLHEHLRDHYDKTAMYELTIDDLQLYGLSRH